MVNQAVVNQVNQYASGYNVPLPIVDTLAYVESGFNPYAYNPNDPGGSYGIFQLNKNGQLGNLTPAQAYDIQTNVTTAMPSIQSAWNNLKSSFNPNSFAWWQKFAAQSGHPGGAPGVPATDSEAKRLQADYTQFASTANKPLPNVGSQVVNSINNDPFYSMVNGLMTADWANLLPRMMLITVGAIIAIIGLVKVVGKHG